MASDVIISNTGRRYAIRHEYWAWSLKKKKKIKIVVGARHRRSDDLELGMLFQIFSYKFD